MIPVGAQIKVGGDRISFGPALAVLAATCPLWSIENGSVWPASAATVQFSASPQSGPAPLTVSFCASAGIAIDFGDGASGAMRRTMPGDCPPGLSSFVSHIYKIPGIYRLRGMPCPSSVLHPECGQAAEQANAVTIRVTSSPSSP